MLGKKTFIPRKPVATVPTVAATIVEVCTIFDCATILLPGYDAIIVKRGLTGSLWPGEARDNFF